jgi:hypothetical protein
MTMISAQKKTVMMMENGKSQCHFMQFQSFSGKIDQRGKPEQALVWKPHPIGIDNHSFLHGREIFRPQFPIQSFPVQIPSQVIFLEDTG